MVRIFYAVCVDVKFSLATNVLLFKYKSEQSKYISSETSRNDTYKGNPTITLLHI